MPPLFNSQEEYDEMGLTEALMEVSAAKNMADLIAIPEEQLIEYYLMPLVHLSVHHQLLIEGDGVCQLLGADVGGGRLPRFRACLYLPQ